MGLFGNKAECSRCHKKETLLPSGLCRKYDGLRNTIGKIQSSYLAGNHEATEKEFTSY